jgi:hypothetical protein
MEPKRTRAMPRRRTSTGLFLVVATAAVVALLAVSQLPSLTAGATASSRLTTGPSVTGATLTLNFTCDGCRTAGFNFTPSPCSMVGSGWADCRITMWIPTLTNGTCSGSLGQIDYLHYWSASGPQPSKFLFVNSDPTFPSPGPNCAQNPGNLYQFWFHVIPSTGHFYGNVVIHAS